jgi:hypothetical protein
MRKKFVSVKGLKIEFSRIAIRQSLSLKLFENSSISLQAKTFTSKFWPFGSLVSLVLCFRLGC